MLFIKLIDFGSSTVRLCEAEILASSSHGRVESLPERLVVVVGWKVEF